MLISIVWTFMSTLWKIQSQFWIITALKYWSSSLKQFNLLNNIEWVTRAHTHTSFVCVFVCVFTFTSKHCVGFIHTSIIVPFSRRYLYVYVYVCCCMKRFCTNVVHKPSIWGYNVRYYSIVYHHINVMWCLRLFVTLAGCLCVYVCECYEEGKCLSCFTHNEMTPPTATAIPYEWKNTIFFSVPNSTVGLSTAQTVCFGHYSCVEGFVQNTKYNRLKKYIARA